MTDQPVGRLWLPEGIDERIRRTVKTHLADLCGGYTVVESRGGWVDERGDLVEENVEVLEAAGLSETEVRAVADWVAEKSDETEVMWEQTERTFGFTGGSDTVDPIIQMKHEVMASQS